MEKVIECPTSTDNKITYEFKKYNYLIFEIKKYKKYIENNVTNLSECLINYDGEKTFKEEKESKPKICNEMCRKSSKSYYYSNPNFLILI